MLSSMARSSVSPTCLSGKSRLRRTHACTQARIHWVHTPTHERTVHPCTRARMHESCMHTYIMHACAHAQIIHVHMHAHARVQAHTHAHSRTQRMQPHMHTHAATHAHACIRMHVWLVCYMFSIEVRLIEACNDTPNRARMHTHMHVSMHGTPG